MTGNCDNIFREKKGEPKLRYCAELPEKLAAPLGLQDVAAVRVLATSRKKKLFCPCWNAWVSGDYTNSRIEPAKQTDSANSLSMKDTEQPVSHLASPLTHTSSTPVRHGSSRSAFSPASTSNCASDLRFPSRTSTSYGESSCLARIPGMCGWI